MDWDSLLEEHGKKVILEDRLEEVENLFADLKDDTTRAKYLKMANSVSFSNICLYVVELPASEHWRPEFKAAKRN